MCYIFFIGITKDLSFRKHQLASLMRFCIEQTDALADALHKDLHKHRMEANVGEISAVVDECKFMIKVRYVLSFSFDNV